ncbi:16S rRNA (guanine(966)-N(2))-methyltransferase RsmD [Pilibacter termitis]|uniref:16S rRNA (Guanine(966)-N(2))-methyltransferase RsmD n=1 Tax=Pilibacter termitis TaxID=263852 RepID=A0A1T4NZG5_9ENTE|nr:16S rRNA (guanine(966)-N(2))-methyltransferase RsmD [Pilibacter termitis]SJZ84591.1 16S rRNA (guanine(966)-N(2))-methyltransferase RsmD [Pilibacter termitis]
MRVISGEFRGRRLKSLDGKNTRPTTDKVKESMFNMLGGFFDGGVALDLFAGSGALGIEAVSRGATQAVLVDRAYPAIQVIKENVALTKSEQSFEVFKLDANKALSKFHEENRQFDYVFLDPPYAKQEIEQQILKMQELDLLSEECIILCETDKEVKLSDEIGEFIQYKQAIYGITAVAIYRRKK